MKVIKTTDLRIWNYIAPDDRPGIYKVISIERHNILADDAKGQRYFLTKPIGIELTPEILLALGFEDWGETEESGITYKQWVLYNAIGGTSDFQVRQYDDGDWKYLIDNTELICLPNLECLHVLQNAFFLFAGYDLQLDITKDLGVGIEK